jgi:hypothetical protein
MVMLLSLASAFTTFYGAVQAGVAESNIYINATLSLIISFAIWFCWTHIFWDSLEKNKLGLITLIGVFVFSSIIFLASTLYSLYFFTGKEAVDEKMKDVIITFNRVQNNMNNDVIAKMNSFKLYIEAQAGTVENIKRLEEDTHIAGGRGPIFTVFDDLAIMMRQNNQIVSNILKDLNKQIPELIQLNNLYTTGNTGNLMQQSQKKNTLKELTIEFDRITGLVIQRLYTLIAISSGTSLTILDELNNKMDELLSLKDMVYRTRNELYIHRYNSRLKYLEDTRKDMQEKIDDLGKKINSDLLSDEKQFYMSKPEVMVFQNKFYLRGGFWWAVALDHLPLFIFLIFYLYKLAEEEIQV